MDAVVLQQRRQLYGPNAALSYNEPLNLVRGEGCWLVDSSETRYLDCVNNVTHCGHGNPKVGVQIDGVFLLNFCTFNAAASLLRQLSPCDGTIAAVQVDGCSQ